MFDSFQIGHYQDQQTGDIRELKLFPLGCKLHQHRINLKKYFTTAYLSCHMLQLILAGFHKMLVHCYHLIKKGQMLV